MNSGGGIPVDSRVRVFAKGQYHFGFVRFTTIRVGAFDNGEDGRVGFLFGSSRFSRLFACR